MCTLVYVVLKHAPNHYIQCLACNDVVTLVKIGVSHGHRLSCIYLCMTTYMRVVTVGVLCITIYSCCFSRIPDHANTAWLMVAQGSSHQKVSLHFHNIL